MWIFFGMHFFAFAENGVCLSCFYSLLVCLFGGCAGGAGRRRAEPLRNQVSHAHAPRFSGIVIRTSTSLSWDFF